MKKERSFEENEKLAKKLNKKIKYNKKDLDQRAILLKLIDKCENSGAKLPKDANMFTNEELEKILETIKI